MGKVLNNSIYRNNIHNRFYHLLIYQVLSMVWPSVNFHLESNNLNRDSTHGLALADIGIFFRYSFSHIYLDGYKFPVSFFFYLGFLSRTFMINRTAGEGGGYFFRSSLPLPPVSQTLRYWPCDYCSELTSSLYGFVKLLFVITLTIISSFIYSFGWNSFLSNGWSYCRCTRWQIYLSQELLVWSEVCSEPNQRSKLLWVRIPL